MSLEHSAAAELQLAAYRDSRGSPACRWQREAGKRHNEHVMLGLQLQYVLRWGENISKLVPNLLPITAHTKMQSSHKLLLQPANYLTPNQPLHKSI